MKQHESPVVIFGEALVDIFENEIVPGGAPFNVARNLAGLGMNPMFISAIGTDVNGGQIIAECARFGMSTQGIQIDKKLQTGQVHVRMTEQGHVFDIPHEQAFDYISANEALNCLQWIGKPQYLYCGSLIQRSETSRAALAAVQRAAQAPVYLDLNLRPAAGVLPDLAKVIGRPQIMKVNDEELGVLLTWHLGAPISVTAGSMASHQAGIASLAKEFGIALLLVTFGADGAAAFDAEGNCIAHEAGIPIDTLVDTVGAGDAFSSVVLTGMMLGWPLATTLARANAFAAAICGVRGAVPSSPEFYDRWIERWFA